MKTTIKISIFSIASALLLTTTTTVLAQKGTGSESGMAREQIKPSMEKISGTVASIKTGPCEKTTGKAPMGTHLVLNTDGNESINLHLGPSAAEAIRDLVKSIKIGTRIEAVAFRTERLSSDQWIAKSVSVEGETVELRNDQLRPVWASSIARTKWDMGPCN